MPDDDDKPTKVPSLILESEDEKRRFKDAEKRREILLSFEDKYEEFFNEIDLKFYDYPDDLGSLIESYVENNS